MKVVGKPSLRSRNEYTNFAFTEAGVAGERPSPRADVRIRLGQVGVAR